MRRDTRRVRPKICFLFVCDVFCGGRLAVTWVPEQKAAQHCTALGWGGGGVNEEGGQREEERPEAQLARAGGRQTQPGCRSEVTSIPTLPGAGADVGPKGR